MLLVVQLALLALPTTRLPRRQLLASTAASLAVGIHRRPARASYGDSAEQALPAFIPSPIRPTGAMANTCEVVALGREDVCLEPKKLISAYEDMQLGKAIETLGQAGLDTSNADLRNLIEAAAKMIAMVKGNDFGAIEAMITALDAATLDRATMGTDSRKAVQSSLSALDTAARKKEASPAAKSLVKLTTELSSVVDRQF